MYMISIGYRVVYIYDIEVWDDGVQASRSLFGGVISGWSNNLNTFMKMECSYYDSSR